MRARADQVHVPHHYVEELRKFIQPVFAQPAPHGCNSVPIVPHPFRWRRNHGIHGAELHERELSAVFADPFVQEEDGSRRIPLDEQRNHGKERRADDQTGRGQQHAQQAQETPCAVTCAPTRERR